jgi:O-antigen/teichoic acid export membrane protein
MPRRALGPSSLDPSVAPPASGLRSVAALIASNALLPLAALATAPLLARALGPEGRGELALSQTVISYASILVLLGAPRAITFYVAKRAHLGFVRLISGVGVVAYASSMLFLATIGRAIWGLDSRTLILIGIALPLTAAADVRRAYLVGLDVYAPSAVERVLLVASRTMLIVGCFLLGVLTPWSALLATCVASAIGAAALLRRPVGNTRRIDKVPRGRFFRFSLSAFPFMLAGYSNARLDQLVIPLLASGMELGIYVVAVAYMELAGYAIAGAETVIGTRATERYTYLDVQRIVPMIMIANILAVVLVLASAPVLLPLLFGELYSGALAPVLVLGLGSLFYGPNRVLAAVVIARGRPAAQSVVEWFGVGLTAAGLLLLVPTLGIVGAAMTSSVVYFSTFVGFLLILRREYSVPAWTLVWRRGVFADVRDIFTSLVRTLLRTENRPNTAPARKG